VISAMEPLELAQALITQDLPRLAGIKGIGLKTAERLVVELKDKAQRLSGLGDRPADAPGAPPAPPREEVTLALVNLGYARAEAEKAIRPALARLGPEADLGAILREALKNLSQ
ncbi:MAG: Holliday junction branch migration protein RuvA, partial [Deltaproteobacteria bacterium]|nr:Holliday junction branch migration protein RuvA [Deltaproteobacteria bacterium]